VHPVSIGVWHPLPSAGVPYSVVTDSTVASKCLRPQRNYV